MKFKKKCENCQCTAEFTKKDVKSGTYEIKRYNTVEKKSTAKSFLFKETIYSGYYIESTKTFKIRHKYLICPACEGEITLRVFDDSKLVKEEEKRHEMDSYYSERHYKKDSYF